MYRQRYRPQHSILCTLTSDVPWPHDIPFHALCCLWCLLLCSLSLARSLSLSRPSVCLYSLILVLCNKLHTHEPKNFSHHQNRIANEFSAHTKPTRTLAHAPCSSVCTECRGLRTAKSEGRAWAYTHITYSIMLEMWGIDCSFFKKKKMFM